MSNFIHNNKNSFYKTSQRLLGKKNLEFLKEKDGLPMNYEEDDTLYFDYQTFSPKPEK